MSKIKLLLLMLVATTLAYAGSLKYGFSQDDWYFLSISVAHNLTDILNFFNPWSQSGFAFYRPLGTQLYYYLGRLFFGLEGAPLGMHIFMVLIQSLCAYNVYRLVYKITKGGRLAVLTGLIYATSAVHFLSLYYIAATQQLLATLFALLAINDYLNARNLRSALWFFLALLCKEIAIMTPIIMILTHYKVTGHINFRKIITSLIPVGVVGVLYVAMKFLSGVEVQSEYHLVFNGSVLSTLRWYFLFAYGAPEELVRYGLPRMGINFAGFIKDYAWQGIVTCIIPIVLGIYAIIRTPRRALYLVWWVVALLPVLFLENHRYPHYVDIALIPLILLLLEKQEKRLQLVLAAILIVASLVSINLSEATHWTTKRAIQAQEQSKIMPCDNPGGVTFRGNKQEVLDLSYSLSLANGPRVICNNPSLPVYYEGVYP